MRFPPLTALGAVLLRVSNKASWEKVRQADDLDLNKLRTMEPTPTELAPIWSDEPTDEMEEALRKGPPKGKTRHPQHRDLPYTLPKWRWSKETVVKYPFPETGLEGVLLYIAILQKLMPEEMEEVTVKDILRVAMEPPELAYEKEWDTRYYLPKEIEDLPETERPSAVLKLLQKIKSSNEFLKSLDPFPEQS